MRQTVKVVSTRKAGCQSFAYELPVDNELSTSDFTQWLNKLLLGHTFFSSVAFATPSFTKTKFLIGAVVKKLLFFHARMNVRVRRCDKRSLSMTGLYSVTQ